MVKRLHIRAAHGIHISGHQPLYERVPTRDEYGKLLSDFMMLIPGLWDWPQLRFHDAVAGLQAVMGQFQEVVFADLNVPLNLLWVSVKAKPGIITEVAGSIQMRVPQALIISPHGRTPWVSLLLNCLLQPERQP